MFLAISSTQVCWYLHSRKFWRWDRDIHLFFSYNGQHWPNIFKQVPLQFFSFFLSSCPFFTEYDISLPSWVLDRTSCLTLSSNDTNVRIAEVACGELSTVSVSHFGIYDLEAGSTTDVRGPSMVRFPSSFLSADSSIKARFNVSGTEGTVTSITWSLDTALVPRFLSFARFSLLTYCR